VRVALQSTAATAAEKLSKQLAEMISLCQRGQEQQSILQLLLFNKMLRKLRILLSEADMDDKQERTHNI
jgi:hypothetical protein